MRPALPFAVCPLYDQARAHRAGAVVPIKVRLCDAAGADLSSPASPGRRREAARSRRAISPPSHSPGICEAATSAIV